MLSARSSGVGLGQFAGLCDTGAIWQLEDHLKQCIDSRQYGAASHVDAQIQHLKQQQEGHALETLAAQQAEDRAGNEAAFAQARQELALKWQERMSHMQEQLMVNQQQMLGRHEEETASLLAAQMNTPARPRFTPQLLNMRRVERNLAEQRNFSKANKVKQQADQQELLELQCWDAEKLGKWELERAGLAAQHAREQAAADKKVASALLEAQLVQQQELEQLTRRFQAAQLAMSRTHAAQQVKAATILRSTLAIPRASSLMSLPSFSLAPPRGLVAPLPLNPAETCRPAHLFEETLPPAPNQGAVQPLMPTLLAGTPGFNGGPVGSQYGSYHKGGLGANPSSSSLANCRGSSPTRCAQGMYARNVSTPRGGGRSAQDSMQGWGGSSILTSGSPNPLCRGGQNAAQPGGGSRNGSPLRNMQAMSHQHGPNSSSSRVAASPARNIQPVSQVAAAYGSTSSHERCASPIKGARRSPDAFSPAAPGTPVPGPSPPIPGANRAALSPNRAGSPSRMPHPPCPCPPSSGGSDRPHSPAVRIRARSPQKAPAGAAANTAYAPPSNMMAPSNGRFHSPSRGRHVPAPPMESQAGRLESPAAPSAHNPYAVPQPQLAHLASRKGAGGPLGVARMSDGMMGAGIGSLQVGPAQQHPPEPPTLKVELSSEQKQWLGQNMQRLQSKINGLDGLEDCLSPPAVHTQVPAAVQEPAPAQAAAAVTVQAVSSDRDDSLATAFIKEQRLLEEQEQQARAEAAVAANAAAPQEYDRQQQEAVAQPSGEAEAAAGVLQQQEAPGFSAAGVDELVETVAAWAGGDN